MIASSGTMGTGNNCPCQCNWCRNGGHCCGTGCSHVTYTTTTDLEQLLELPWISHDTIPNDKPIKPPLNKPKAHYRKNKKPWEQ